MAGTNDPLNLKAALKAREAQGEAAVSPPGAGAGATAANPAPASVPSGVPSGNSLNKVTPPATDAQKAKSASRLADLLKARDAQDAAYADAWHKDPQPDGADLIK